MKIELENAVVYQGSNLDVLPSLPDNSVDSIVTDPPYELGFMGKKWDSSGIAYNVELWRECLRVLKPGGHLLSFGGSRTWHRIAVAIEDAGFEVRDSIAWMYGSGFPKSLDISKAIDKRGGQGATLTKQIGKALKEARESRGISKAEADQMFCDGSTNWTWFEGRPAGQRPPTPETFARIVAEWKELEALAALVAEAEREVIGQQKNAMSGWNMDGTTKFVDRDITAPSTPEAQQWEGWGTALKPAFEPVIVARKPLIGTVAENVLTYGTGGLNIDGSRIGTEEIKTSGGRKVAITGDEREGAALGMYGESEPLNTVHTGRWPANIILDPYTAELLDEQSGITKSQGGRIGKKDASNVDFGLSGNYAKGDPGFGDVGGASRYFKIIEGENDESTNAGNSEGNRTNQSKLENNTRLGPLSRGLGMGIESDESNSGRGTFIYQAKASKKDRNEGLDDLEGQAIGAKGNGLARTCATCGSSVLDGCDCPDRTFVNPTRANFHPTVKPTTLMEYLIKLVTPPNGTVLDPFTGSGSTGKAALLNGFKFIGIELTEEYLPIIEGRLKWASEQASKKEEEKNEVLF